MMKFNEKYNREDFIDFLNGFLPEDVVDKKEDIVIKKERYKEITQAEVLGYSPSLDLYILEMDHSRENDPRIAIATDAFKILADHWIHRALVIFKNKESENYRLSYLTISLDINEKNKPIKKYSNARRYSFYLGAKAKIKTPHQQLIKKGRVKDIEDLLNRFSVEVVNREFYNEIQNAFDFLTGDVNKEEAQLKLPGMKNAVFAKDFAVRLIGRIMFCWFLKQKKTDSGQLIPEEILSSKAVVSDYYHSTLEPLFFEVLNTPIDTRDIRSELFDKVPYLNGGLFSPQSGDYYEFDRGSYSSKYINTLNIADGWFLKLFELLETYNFTIDENTAIDQELSVDPEMLGRIFENLLATINPETGTSERKQTGSFYTPRQIVEFMVDQSLLEYLKSKTNVEEAKLSALVSYDLNDDLEHPLSDEEKEKIVGAIEALKVLDPACGSGAFPIGTLQKIVHILQSIDPECNLTLAKKIESVPELYKQKIINDAKANPFNYTRKLDVIKNSIFGVDIQPIAVDVSRLRCFLTLVVEAEGDDAKPNRGIDPLPNLDFKFVCANTLIGAPEQNATKESLFGDDFQEKLSVAVDRYFSSSGENKRGANNEIHKLIDRKVDEKLNHLSGLVSYNGDKKMESLLAKKNEKQISAHSQILHLWNSYKNIFENKPVGFFETKYFFPSVKDGFDSVIGNPPYVQLQKFARTQTQKDLENEKYETFAKTADLYSLFYERGISLLKKGGVLSFITSNKWMRAGYGEKLRAFFLKNNPLLLADLGGNIFESATVDTNILIIKKEDNKNELHAVTLTNKWKDDGGMAKFIVENSSHIKNLSSNAWSIGNDKEQNLKSKIEKIGKPLKDWDIKINYGVKTALNEAFIIDTPTRERLVADDPKSAEILRPILRGRDIKRYGYEWAGLWIIASGFDIDVPQLYPAIYKHLLRFEEKAKKRDDQGKNWWNLRACVYYPEFEKEKLVWPMVSTGQCVFTKVDSRIFLNNKCYFITGGKLSIFTGILNSKLAWYYFSNQESGLGANSLEIRKEGVETFPIPGFDIINKKEVDEVESLVTQILARKYDDPKADTSAEEQKIDQLVYHLYGLTEEEIALVESSVKK